MRSVTAPVTAESKSLYELGGFTDPNCNEVLLQAPLSNGAEVFFGAKNNEVAFLLNGAAAGLTITSLKNCYIKGTPGDDIIIVAM